MSSCHHCFTTTASVTYHAKPGALRGTAVTADCEKLLEQLPSGLLPSVRSQQLVREVHVAGGLDVVLSKRFHRVKGPLEVALVHVPARALGHGVHEQADNYGRQGCDSNHPSPLGVGAQEVGLLECEGDDEAQHDAKGRPHLPHHGHGPTNRLGSALGGVDGSGAGLGADGETENQPCNEERDPVLGHGLPNGSDKGQKARNGNGPATAPSIVERRIEPASDEGRGSVGRAIDEALHQLVGYAKLAKVKGLCLRVSLSSPMAYHGPLTWAPLMTVWSMPWTMAQPAQSAHKRYSFRGADFH